MHIYKSLYLTIITILLGINIQAQTIEDALRYSILNPTGTAAMMGIGSASGAIGGDYSTMHINPAGLADFTTSKFVFTPMISTYNSEAGLDEVAGNLTRDNKSSFSIANVGFVNVNESNRSSIRRFNIGLGFSKMADFNSTIRFEGASSGSILDYLVILANDAGVDNLNAFDTQLASEAGALILDQSTNEYFSDLDGVDLDQPILKEQNIVRSGGMNELNLTLAGNASNKLNFGFHLGIPFVNFEETKVYTESGPGLEISPFESLEYIETLNTSGVGINFKTGIQYKVVPEVRVGLAVHSPTLLSLTEDFNSNFSYSYFENQSISGSSASPDGSFRYRVTNPWRAIGSIGGVYNLGSIKGFISGDVEFADYSSTSFNLTANSDDLNDARYEQQLNQEIGDVLRSVVNYRLGTELAIEDFRVRAGLGLNQSPYSVDENTFDKIYSLGIGIRLNGFFLDLAYRRSLTNTSYYPYFLDSEGFNNPQINIQSTNNNFAITTGFNF